MQLLGVGILYVCKYIHDIMGLKWVLRCFRRDCIVPKVLLHSGQGYLEVLLCCLRWSLRIVTVLNSLLHSGHSSNPSFMWLSTLCLRPSLHSGKLRLLSEVCKSIWCFSYFVVLKTLLHSKQLKLVPFAWSWMWVISIDLSFKWLSTTVTTISLFFIVNLCMFLKHRFFKERICHIAYIVEFLSFYDFSHGSWDYQVKKSFLTYVTFVLVFSKSCMLELMYIEATITFGGSLT